MRLILIRHCESLVDPGRPASTWGLTEAGFAQARELAASPLLSGVEAVACGNEPKMSQTVEPLARQIEIGARHCAPTARFEPGPVVDDRFSESAGSDWLNDDAFRSMIASFFDEREQDPAPGWESAWAAAERFLAGLNELFPPDRKTTVAVCSGGRVLTAVLAKLRLICQDATYDALKRLQMPDIAIVDLDPHPTLIHPFGSAQS